MGSKFYGSGSKWFGGGGNVPSSSWIVAGAVVDLDFVNQRYYFNGAVKSPDAFSAFSGGTFSSGLVLDGVANNHNISIPFASTGLSTPCSLHASVVPATVATTQFPCSIDIDVNNFFAPHLLSAAAYVQIATAGVTQAAVAKGAAASVGVRITLSGQMETNNILQSVDGATGGTADTSATLFAPTILRIGERSPNTNPWNGTIRRIVAFNGTKNQTQLNAESALVHAT